MADMGENGTGGTGGPANINVTEVLSDVLGLTANPQYAQQVVNWELNNGLPLLTGYAAIADFAADPPLVQLVAGAIYGAAGSQIAALATSGLNQISSELGRQADIMGTINLDGQMFEMADPVSGMGYML